MSLRTLLFGRPLRTEAEADEQIGPLQGIPVLGLDALASASYGPEAALTVLLAAGAAASGALTPVAAGIVGLLLLVYFSYRQTIAAYPNGGGSFTVANENLGPTAGLVAAAALATDYILNAAVAISAGVGAVVSAVPALLPHTLALCLGVLTLLTIVNLRGIRSAGLVFTAPTYAFIGSLGVVLALGIGRLVADGGTAFAAETVPQAATAAPAGAVGLWLLLRAFASGCTAMTGVEAVSNGVPLFRQPTVRLARRTLTLIVVVLITLIAGLTVLVGTHGITATVPGEPGYESVVSQVVAAVVGRGAFYYVTMAAVLAVLALSANTSFADFPRVCRVLAAERYLPPEFARRGSRLVFTSGIVVLAVLAGILLVVFGGITDHLIPLFAIGALLAFTMSQLGMVAHWRRADGEAHRRLKIAINACGAAATAGALVIVLVSKFSHGAWITALVIPAFIVGFRAVRRYNDRIAAITAAAGPIDLSGLLPPIVVIPLRRLDRVGEKAIRFALSISDQVLVVQVLAEELDTDDLRREWRDRVEAPVERHGGRAPRLVQLRSPYRRFFERLLAWLQTLTAENPQRQVIVLIPELVQRRWYQPLVSHRAWRLRARLLSDGGPQVSVMTTPWYRDPAPAAARRSSVAAQ